MTDLINKESRLHPVDDSKYIYRYAYDVNNDVEYIGKAVPGTAEVDSAWQIRKFVYTAGLVQSQNFPQKNSKQSNGFEFSWTNRATFTYAP